MDCKRLMFPLLAIVSLILAEIDPSEVCRALKRASLEASLGKRNDRQNRRLVLISFDGLRHDLVNSSTMPNLDAWSRKGVRFTNGIEPVTLTYTAPNHESMVTGLYADSHGIVANMFLDQATGEFFDIFNQTGLGMDRASKTGKWFTSEPIWETNRLQGGRSAVFHWPVGDSTAKNGDGRYFKGWEDAPNTKEQWLKDVALVDGAMKCDANLVVWYSPEPDATLHKFGFQYDGQLGKALKDLDDAFGTLIQTLDEDVDIILTADHGHAEIKSRDTVFCVDQHITGTAGIDYLVGDQMIFPFSMEQAVDMYTNLSRAIVSRGFDVKIYWKQQLPSSWHYAHPTRVGAIVLQPGIGSHVTFRCDVQFPSSSAFHHSSHGHDATKSEMRAFLAAVGISFRTRTNILLVPKMVDVYPLITSVLGIEGRPNNGTMEIVGHALRL